MHHLSWILVIFFLLAAAFQAWGVYKIRGLVPFYANRAAHFAGAHGLMMVAMALGWPVWVWLLSALPPIAWGVIDILAKIARR